MAAGGGIMAHTSLSDAQILAKLTAALLQPDEPIPKGFKSAEDFGKSWGKSGNYAHAILSNGAKAGLVDRIFCKRDGKRKRFFRFKG